MLVSVVIPALNEAERIADTVAAARRTYTRDQVELIVVDGGSSDGTPEQVPGDAVVIRSARGRAVQMNRGAAAARGALLVFCHGDTCLPHGWREAVVAAVSRPGVIGGAFSIRFLPARGILHVLNRIPFPVDWRIMYGDQVQFATRSAFERAGGFPEIACMEDVELMRRLHATGTLVRLPLRVTTSSRRFLERGPLRQMALNTGVVVGYLAGAVSAEDAARAYCVTRRDGAAR